MVETPNQRLVPYIVCVKHFIEEALLIKKVNISFKVYIYIILL